MRLHVMCNSGHNLDQSINCLMGRKGGTQALSPHANIWQQATQNVIGQRVV